MAFLQQPVRGVRGARPDAASRPGSCCRRTSTPQVLARLQRARRPRRRLGDRARRPDEAGARPGRGLRPGLRREPREAGVPAAPGTPPQPPPPQLRGRRCCRRPLGEYLLEVGSEEIPARMLEPGVRELATRVVRRADGRAAWVRARSRPGTRRAGWCSSSPDCRSASPTARSRCWARRSAPPSTPDGSPKPALTGFAKRAGVERRRARAGEDGEGGVPGRDEEDRGSADSGGAGRDRPPRADRHLLGQDHALGERRGSLGAPGARGRLPPRRRGRALRPVRHPRGRIRRSGIRRCRPSCSGSVGLEEYRRELAARTWKSAPASVAGCCWRPCAPGPRRWAAGWWRTGRCSTSSPPCARSRA